MGVVFVLASDRYLIFITRAGVRTIPEYLTYFFFSADSFARPFDRKTFDLNLAAVIRFDFESVFMQLPTAM